MTPASKLLTIKIVHTAIWIFMNAVIFYFLIAVIMGIVDRSVWIALGVIALEVLILLLYKWNCPLTILARRYSTSEAENFDIFLPIWLARHNKTIYSTIVFLGLVILAWRMIG